MAAQNLTVCWWPTLLHPEFKSLEDVANESQLSAFVEQWVRHSEKLFGIPNAGLDAAEENVEAETPQTLEEIPADPLYAQVQMTGPPAAGVEGL